MATLSSPGVSVTITDESQYLPAPTNSIPFILMATAQNKVNPGGTGVATGTTAANANKLFRITSQRDLVNLYGNPLFYTTSTGTPLQGYELNEYGLLAAYSALGISNTVYCMRADIDLASLVGQVGRPTSDPVDGTLWLDTSSTAWGIYQYSTSLYNQFTLQSPIVITNELLLSNGLPINTLGNIGDYAVNAIPTYDEPTNSAAKQFFYKMSDNTWTYLGSNDWLNDIHTVRSLFIDTPLTSTSGTFEIRMSGVLEEAVSISVVQNTTTLTDIANDINNAGYGALSAAVINNRLAIYSSQAGDSQSTPKFISFGGVDAGGSAALVELGFSAALNYYQPIVQYGKSTQQPLWTPGQTVTRPTGSVWLKMGTSGNGFAPVISEMDAIISTWENKTVALGTSDWDVISQLDSTGGSNIATDTVYAQYNFDAQYSHGPVYYWKKAKEGTTLVQGSINSPTFDNGPHEIAVKVSVPGTTALSSARTVSIIDNGDADDFVTAWTLANIPYTNVGTTSSGAIYIEHTAGGVVHMDDVDNTDVFTKAGFTAGFTPYVKLGMIHSETVAVTTSTNDGAGNDDIALSIGVSNYYAVNSNSITSGGTNYAVGDLITVAGTDLGGASPANDLVVLVTSVNAGVVDGLVYVSGSPTVRYGVQLSNWVEADVVAQSTAPVASPTNGTIWFYSVTDQVDIMINYNGAWRGYGNQNYDFSGFPTPSGVNATDPNGPIISASEPTTQSDGTALVYGDLWIDTSDLENYPMINRWQALDGTNQWVRIDNTDGVNSNGIVFADARWATDGTTNPATDDIPLITALLASDYVDLDVPSPDLYPTGTLLFNTRRSGYNVKEFRSNYFNSSDFSGQILPTARGTWLSISGLAHDGSPYMGRKAQRAVVVKALKAAIDTNTEIRVEDNFFNLIATPNYPELQPNMITLNSDRSETAFIIGDTPLRLAEDATAIQNWATNTANAATTGEEGLVTRSTYMGLFYPSGLTTDLSGNEVVVPASHMMIRTILRSDSISYPWLAPAGTRRGIIDNALSIGYLNATTGEYQATRSRVGIRDVLYTNNINPLVFFTGNGLLNYGNKTSSSVQRSLDRINVARLIAYLRRQLEIAARPFVFEPNDALTRQQISSVIQTLMVDIVAKRGIYDYLVVCDSTNNTPARIDRNELWVDIAIEPVKAAEFIYIPVRILNTNIPSTE